MKIKKNKDGKPRKKIKGGGGEEKEANKNI
jgi:hypothetical protein